MDPAGHGFAGCFDTARVVRLRVHVCAKRRGIGGRHRHAHLRQRRLAEKLNQIVEGVVEVGDAHPAASACQALLDADVQCAAPLGSDRGDAEARRRHGGNQHEQRRQLLRQVWLFDPLAGVEGHLGIPKRLGSRRLTQIRRDRHTRRGGVARDLVAIESDATRHEQPSHRRRAGLGERAVVGARRFGQRPGKSDVPCSCSTRTPPETSSAWLTW